MSSRVAQRSLLVLVVLVVAVAFTAGLALAASDPSTPASDPAGSMVLEPTGCDEGGPSGDGSLLEADASYAPADLVDGTALEGQSLGSLLDLSGADQTAVAGCSPCPGCKCKYQGLPRVSCNPCCYGNLGIPMVCLN